MRRNVVDVLVALTMATLLMTPVQPAARRSESTSPWGKRIGSRGTDVAAGPTVGLDPLLEAQDESPVRSGQSTALVPEMGPPDTSGTTRDAAYVVRVGPVSVSNAADITLKLRAAHYPSRMEDGQIEPQRFRVVSAPMRRSAARRLASALGRRGFPSFMRSLPDDRVEVQFGVFSTQRYARELADRMRGRGYTPAVVREGAVRIITVGPYSRAAVKAIVKVTESTMSYHSLAMVPCGSNDPLIHARRGWVQVCKVSSGGVRPTQKPSRSTHR